MLRATAIANEADRLRALGAPVPYLKGVPILRVDQPGVQDMSSDYCGTAGSRAAQAAAAEAFRRNRNQVWAIPVSAFEIAEVACRAPDAALAVRALRSRLPLFLFCSLFCLRMKISNEATVCMFVACELSYDN